MSNRLVRSIPNVFSSLNLFCGALGTAFILQGEVRLTLLLSLLCFFFDVIDGYAARRLGAYSLFGKELDSLADLVSFGMLPASILYFWMSTHCPSAFEWSIAPVAAYLLVVASALRLAKFNIDDSQGIYFRGLPTPSASLFVLGLLYMHYAGHPWVDYFHCKPVFFLLLIVLLPLLLISGVRLWSLKAVRKPNGKIILGGFIIFFLLLLFLVREAAFSLMVIAYLIFGFINSVAKIYGNEIQS